MSATDLSSRLSSLSPAQRALLELALRKKGKPAEAPPAVPTAAPSLIPPRAQHDRCPLSIDQERLWFIQQLDLASPIYNIYSAHRHKGPLDAGLFTRALDIVVARHEILRTSFPAIDGRPVQEIAPELRTSMLVVDLRGLRDLPRVVREDEAYRVAMMACREPFDLSRLPLFHSVLVQVDDEDFIHPISIHHIITDRVAAYVFENEVTELYRMLSTGQPPVLPPVGLQFADFAVWQRERLKDEAVMAEHVAYWRTKLSDAPELSTLPPDRPRPAVQTPWGARRRIAISTAMADEFRAFSKAMDVTMFISGLAIWKSVLVRLSGQEKMIVGTPMNYRQVLDVPHVLGFFLNQIPLYTDLGGDPTFREILGRVRTTSLEAYAHHELPFARMVELLRPERDLSRVPYTQVVFLLLDPPQTGWASMPGIESRPYWMDAQRTQFDMNMALFWVEDTGLTGMLEYNTDLFDAVTMDRVKQQFRLILGAVLENPDRRLSDLPLLSEAQRHQVVQEWSAPRLLSGAAEGTLHGAFAAQAARHPEAPAVTYEDSTLSYGDLNRRANRLAHRLLTLGARGGLVALAAGRGLDLVTGILGILKAGCAYVPIDPAQPAERLAFLLGDCGAPVLVADAAARESFPAWQGRTLALEEALEAEPDHEPDVFADAGSPAYVIYTSGSTGQPKGVVVTHGNVLRLFSATDPLFGFGADDVWTLFHSFAFDFSVWELWGALLHGGRLVVVPYWVSRSPEAFAELLSRERVTVLNQTPKAFRQLIPEVSETFLRWVIFGGEALQARSLAPWIERFGDGSPGLVNMYGITETTVHVTFHRVMAREVATSWTSRIGTPIPDLAVRVLDVYGTPVPMGVEGEMCVGGPGLAMGYLGRPELTAERFVPDPWSAVPGGRLYRSGDLGRFRPDSGLEYLRRADHQVKVRGFRIELGEIETALTAHPRIAAAAVLALADGAGDSRLIAYVVGKDGETLGVEELRSHLALRLPEHMLPAVFIPLAALPLTANGKLDRRALPAPGIERPELSTEYAAPTNATEQALAEIWAEILGVEKAGIHDNFFSLGGDSIVSLRVVALAAKRGISTSLQDIFRHQTIARIAAAASTDLKAPAQETGPGAFSLVSADDRRRLPADLEDAYPLTQLQAGMLYHMALAPDEALYHDVGTFHLRARFEPAVFRDAVDRVTARHAVLRTSFDLAGDLSGGGEPLQLVHRAATVPIEIEDWQGLSPAEQEAAVERRIEIEKLRLFDLARAPQMRFHAALRSPSTFQLTLVENHAIFDGWSLHSTVTEIFELYFVLLGGANPPPAPPPPVAFRDYVRLEREALASPEAAAFWERALAELPPAELPSWPHPDSGTGLRVRTRRAIVPPALLAALKDIARRAGVPVKSVLLGVHARVLSHLCGQPAVVTGLVTNGRLEETGGDEVRGLFLNTLPLRLELPAGDRSTWLDLAREAFRAEQEIFPFRRTPYAVLQRQAGDRPLYEMAFNYVHFHVARSLAESGHLEVLSLKMVEAASFKLMIAFAQTPSGDGLACEIEYDAHELPDAQVQAIAGTYLRCLAALAADPEAPFAAVSLLSEAERHQILREENDTAAPLGCLTVAALFAAQAARRPAAVAVVSDSGDLSYGDLDAQANRLARHLLGSGVKPEAPIGVCAERGPHLAVALLAVLKAGGAYLPLDPGQPRERLALILEDAGCTTVLAEEGLRGVLPDGSEKTALRIIPLGAAEKRPHPRPLSHLPPTPPPGEGRQAETGAVGLAGLPSPGDREGGAGRGAGGEGPAEPAWHAESAAPPALPLLPEQLAYVIYTSGSTGRPKGIGLPHRVLLNLVTWQIGASRDPAARTLQFAAPSFDVSLQETLATWCAGGTLVAAPEEARRDAGLLARLLREQRIERLFLPYVALRQLAEQMSEQAVAPFPPLPVEGGAMGEGGQGGEDPTARRPEPLHLREVITAGERLQVTPQLRSFFHNLPACTLHNHYGPSETHAVTEHILTGDPAGWPTLPPVGRPIANTRAYLLGVLDGAFRPVPVGTPGELLFGGEGLARGYVGRADWTAERFVPDGVSGESGARLYRTGDLARLRPDGAIEFLGRIDHQVKIRGFRVEPEEIEAALQAHPAVRESAVVPVESAGNVRLVAFVVTEPLADLAGELRRFLGQTLPAYMIPAAFVPLAALPQTRSGKADRRALAKLAPEAMVSESAAGAVHGVAPRGPVEEAVAAIWREVLHLGPTGAVSVHDSFFDLGGHSLLATQVISRVRSAFGIDLPLALLFEAPTVAGLARQIERGLRQVRHGELPDAPPLVPQARPDVPLSFAQERLWFLDRLAPGSPVYNIPLALRLDGALHLPALAAAVGEVVRRHEALRTVFAEGANGPVQVVRSANDPATFVLPSVDLSGLGERAEEEALRFAREEAALPFDLARGPLFRTRRLRLPRAGGEASLLLATMHHVISDGWSLSVLVREIGALYAAFTRGLPSPLPELPIQYPDFALWQRSWLTGEVLAAQIGYWRETLAGLPPLLPLPIDRPRPQTPSFHGAHVATALSAALTIALQAQGRRAGATPFMVLLAGVQALFARLTGEDDLAVGTAIAGRGQVETEGLIGFFVNSLVLRGRLDGDPALPELLARVRATALGAYAHQDLPFERLVAELGVERSLSHAPLFQVMVTLQNTPREVLELPGLRLAPVNVPGETAKSDLTITLSEVGPEITVDWEYATSLFDGPTIERIAAGFERLLAAWLETPSLHLADLPLLGEAEALQIAAWSRPQAVSTAPACLHELFTAVARRNPGAVAVSSEGKTLTYEDLDQQSDRLARRLLRAGLGSGDAPVAICLDRSPEMLVGLLAILKTGRAYLPLDPDHPAERKAFILHDARAELLLTRKDLQAGLPPHEARVVLIEDQKDPKDCKDTKDRDEGLETVRVPPESPAYVLYTSGSTGEPKGVVVSHAAVARLFTAAAPRAGFTAQDVWPLFHSYAFDVSVWEMWGALLYGGRLVVVPYWVSRSPEEFLALLARERVTVLNQTPSAFRQLLTAASPPDLALRLVIFAGEALEPASLAPWFDRHGDEHPQMINMYGITETTVHVTWRRMRRGDLERPALGSPIGEPLADLAIVLTDRTLQPVPHGVPGEICVGGAGLAQGYLRRPDLTATRFIPNPFGDPSGIGERLYRSGDLARRLADGSLEYLGRTDHQVKVRGFRIELGEIEAALLRHPDVEQAIVAVIPDVEGKGNRLAAYLVARRSDDGLFADLQRHLRDTLPEPMIPGAWVRLAAMPLTPSGKLDRRGLPGPDTALARAAAPQSVAPRGPVEEAVAAIWREVLHIGPSGAVSAHDSFFDLGGHSLLATQVISRVRNVFGIDLPLVRLFETPTVAGLARQIERGLHRGRRGVLPAAPPLLRQARRDAALPLSFAQERLWFLDRLAPGTAVYNIPLALRLDGALHLPALAAAVGEVVRRHEALRTVFTQSTQNAGQPVQEVRPEDDPAAFTVPTVDLSELAAGRAEDEARRLAREEAALPFDLARGPLFRTRRLRLPDRPEDGGETSLLLATMHHVISDGWSLSVLVREIGALYAAFTRGLPSPLPELPIQYADFALWQRSWLTGEVLASQIGYWRETLAGLPPLLPLPLDRPRPQTPSFRGAHVAAELSASLTAALHAHGRRAGATPFMLLLAVFQALFARLTGEDDLAVGTAIAGRGQVETEDLIGFFVNSLVLRGRLDGDPALPELLARVRATALDAYAHQDLPFERLVAELGVERSLAHTPLFQVMVTLQNTPQETLDLPGLRLSPAYVPDIPGETAKSDLTITLSETGPENGPEMIVDWEYATDLFDGTTVERMAARFERLLAAWLETPALRLADLPLLGEAEAQQIAAWSHPQVTTSAPSCLHELFTVTARRSPGALAVSCDGKTLTYGDLDQQSDRLARHLLGMGLGDAPVAICIDRSPEMLVGLLAILKTGRAYLPLDPDHPAERKAFILRDARAELLLTRKDLQAGLPPHEARVVLIEEEKDQKDCKDTKDRDERLETLRVPPESPAYVLYTSGSTGEPKGVAVSHAAVARLFTAAAPLVGFSENDAWSLFHSYAFDFSVWEMWGALLYGGKLVVVPYWVSRSPEEFLALLARERVTVLNQTPSAFRQLSHLIAAESRSDLALRLVIFGGEALEPASLAPWFERHGDDHPQLINMYGITETTVHVTWRRMRSRDLERPALGSPIGEPLADLAVVLADRTLQAVPPGVPGEICVGGAGLAQGYLRRPDLTATRFVPSPFGNGERLYRSGDLTRRLPDGSLEYLGRIDHQVKVRGFRIELGEIEAALLRHPDVEQAIVAVNPEATGLAAYLVSQRTDAGLFADLQRHLRDTLPEPMIPAVWLLLAALPLTPSGKIDRRGLPAPDTALGRAAAREFVAPRTPLEEHLAEVFAEVLNIEPGRIGIHDNFFDLGGHSLLATIAIAHLRDRWSLEVPLRTLFEATDLADLADRITEQELSDSPDELVAELLASLQAGKAS
jgi:amino acid adenylation domain-containing protein